MQNVGVEKATEAAQAIVAKLAVPDDRGDFNDLYVEYDKREVRRQLKKAVEVDAPSDDPSPTIVPSDVAFGDLFVAQHSKDVKFCEEGWEVWDDTRWKNDSLGEIQERGKDTARSIFDLAKNAESLDDQSKFGKWGVSALNKARIDSGIGLASSNRKVRLTMADFDRDPMLFNVANGTFDLRTEKLRPHNRSDLITRICPVAYDEAARCPLWLKFLDTIFERSKPLIQFVQRAIGYSLTGLTTEQCLFLCYGNGANGKTVLLETLRDLMSDYGLSSSIDTFIRRGNRGIPNDVARLAGARLVTIGETPEFGSFNESLLKDLTGGDTITARFLHKEFFEFRPQFKLWIRANHKPAIKGTDEGIWRRIRLIPFKVTIPPKKRDPDLLEKLRAELPGILIWGVQGYLDWRENGLQTPSAVRRATKSYRKEQDILGTYLKDCIQKKRSSHIMAAALYSDYSDWCDSNGETSVSSKQFSAAMEEREYDKKKVEKGMAYQGINFRK